MKLKKIDQHLVTILKHKWYVLKLSIRAGIPWRGLVHDLSKFSPTEFFESAKYFQGTRSPIVACRKENGYSKAWLHHKGRNKHHPEYWYDPLASNSTPIMPYCYAVEMACDTLAAGMVYAGKEWTTSTQLNYWRNSRDKTFIHPKMREFLEEIYIQVSENGIEKTITKQNLKTIYQKYCGERKGRDY